MILPGWLPLVLTGSLVLMFLIQLMYWLFQYSGVGFTRRKEAAPAVLPKVSVIICARNELKNLRTFLPSVLDQQYAAGYQVVVVNDCSWDESAKYLEELEDAYPHLKVVTLREQEKYQHGKKFALTLGIKGAEHEHLLFTDADCKPVGANWITSMMTGFTPGKEIVIGYGAYFRESGLLNKWIRFDTAVNALLYLSRAMKGKAYMGVGRNMAYVKPLFFRNKGFASHYHLMSGDDDLFVNETAKRNNTAVVLSPASFTYSKPKTSFGHWFWQKKRHMSSGAHYHSRDRRLIGMYFTSQVFFWLFVIITLILKLYPELVVSMVATRLAVQMIICWKGFKKLGETDLLPFVPFFDLAITFLYPVLAVTNLFIKTKSWK
jgi:cellulose synthase/poly-beta-1,6-N-acetylglucosamine synthase-like glycosyltransferase